MTAGRVTDLALPALSPTPLVSPEFEQRVRHFLHYESRLLDERLFRDWVALFTDDASYQVPVRVNREDGAEPFSQSMSFDDTKQTLAIRIERLHTEFAWSEQPPSRVRHYIANVMIAPADTADNYHVVSNELVYRNRGDSVGYDLFSIQRIDLLRVIDSQLRIARRRVELDQTTIGAHNLSMFF